MLWSGNSGCPLTWSLSMEEDQEIIVPTQLEKKDTQKDSSMSGIVNEVISLDDDDVGDNDVDLAVDGSKQSAGKQNDQKEAAVDLSNNTEQQKENANEIKIKFRFRARSKSVTVNDNRSISDGNNQSNHIDSTSRNEGLQKKIPDQETNKDTTKLRAPVICLLGHIDTGKTSLLDKIRGISFPGSDAGVGTQQVAATNIHVKKIRELTKIVKEFQEFNLMLPGLLVIDTPGQKSLSNLRSTGTNGCDMAILVVDITLGLEPQSIECITLLKKKQTPFIVALNKIDKIQEWKKSPNQQVEETIVQQKSATVLDYEQKINFVIKQFSEQGLDAGLHFKTRDQKSCISLVPTSAETGDGISDLMALICKLTQTILTGKETGSEELDSTAIEEKSGENQNEQKSDDSSLPVEAKKGSLIIKNRFKQTSTTLDMRNVLSPPHISLDHIEDVVSDKIVKSKTIQRSLSESEASQATNDGDSFQNLISNYVYDTEVENPSEKQDESTSIPASVITAETADDDKDNIEPGHHCEFKKNNGTYCENVTSTRFCDYHQRVLKAVELFISKRVASRPSKVSDAVSLIETPEESVDKHEGGLMPDTSKTLASKRRLSENSNDSEIECIQSEGEKRLDLSTSRFRRKKCKSVCAQSEDSDSSHPQIDLSISSVSRKVGKPPRFKYLRNLTTCQNEVHKSNLPPTVRKLLDKKHSSHAIVPNVRMHTHSQSESENEISIHDKRKDRNTSHQLANVSCEISTALSDGDDNINEPISDSIHSSQTSSLNDSDISDLSLLQRLHETIQPVHKDITPTQDIDPISAPDPNVLEKLFSIQAPVFSKTMSPTVTSTDDSVSKILFNLNNLSNSFDNSCLPGNISDAAKALPVNVITSVMSSPTSVVSVMNQPLASSIAVMSSTPATSTKSMPVSVIMTPSTSVMSVTSEISAPVTKSFSISVITKPSATLGHFVIVPSKTLSSESVTVTEAPLKTTPPIDASTPLTNITTTECAPSVTTTVSEMHDWVIISSPTSVIQSTQVCSTIQAQKITDKISTSKPSDAADSNCNETNNSPSKVEAEVVTITENLLPVVTSNCTSSVITRTTSGEIIMDSLNEGELSIRNAVGSELPDIDPCGMNNITAVGTDCTTSVDDFTEHEREFINCVKTRRHSNKVTENVNVVDTEKNVAVSECTSVTTSCYVPVISSSVDSSLDSPSLDVETITTLFCFKGPIISNSPNIAERAQSSSTCSSSIESTSTTTTIKMSDTIPVIIETANEPITVSGSDADSANTSNEICIDLTTNEQDASDSTSKLLADNIESTRNNGLSNSLNSNNESELSRRLNATCSEEHSNKYFTPDSTAKYSSGMDGNKPRQSSFMQSSGVNKSDLSVNEKIQFQEELSCIDKTDEIRFHSVNSDLNSTGCSEMSCDESLGDANSTFENYKSFESDDNSQKENEKEISVKNGDSDVPDMIKDVISIPGDSDDEKDNSIVTGCNIGEDTITELEKELNKLQTDEDEALEKLTKANKSLERLKIEMGKLQDEISLHANNMQKISGEKKKLRVTLQQWRTLREHSVNRTSVRNFSSKEHTPNGKISPRKSCTSSDENVPLSFTKDKKILEKIPMDENIRVVKTICVYDSMSSCVTDNSFSDNTESENGSGYDTAPGSPVKNSKSIQKKDKKDKKNQENDSVKLNSRPERRNSLRCRRELRERPGKSKTKK